MRLSVVKLITGKEIRDLVRDRRTVMLIFVLPLCLFPLFGLTGWVFARAALGQETAIGVIGLDNLTVPSPFPFASTAFTVPPAARSAQRNSVTIRTSMGASDGVQGGVVAMVID